MRFPIGSCVGLAGDRNRISDTGVVLRSSLIGGNEYYDVWWLGRGATFKAHGGLQGFRLRQNHELRRPRRASIVDGLNLVPRKCRNVDIRHAILSVREYMRGASPEDAADALVALDALQEKFAPPSRFRRSRKKS